MMSKNKIKTLVDIVMTVGVLVLMTYQATGKKLHEYVGALMLVVFVVHNILNARWYTGLFKGKYAPRRVWATLTNVGLIVCMVLQMCSGIAMSQHAFAFLPSLSHKATARAIHLAASQWCFLFVGLHLGNHWQMIRTKLLKRFGGSKTPHPALRVGGYALAACGVYAFISNGVWKYMLAQEHFYAFDSSEPLLLTVAKLACMLYLYAAVGHLVIRHVPQR